MNNTSRKEILDDFHSTLPENLDNETNRLIEECLGLLINNITFFENFEGISDENIDLTIKNLINTFKVVVDLLIKR